MIKFSPDVIFHNKDIIEEEDDILHQVGGEFTPKRSVVNKDCVSVHKSCGALSIKWFPKKADHGDIIDFLVSYGLPKQHKEVNIKDNGQVIVQNLDKNICEKMCTAMTGNKFKNRKTIYCQGIVLVTPEKVGSTEIPGRAGPTSDVGQIGPVTTSGMIINTSSSKNDVDDSHGDFEFDEVDKSKFYKKPNCSDSESDCSEDSLASKVEMWQENFRKRKSKVKVDVRSSKKLDKKTTPNLKKKH